MTGDYQTPECMGKKLEAIPLPDLKGKTVLDLGCDHGYWSKLASDRGAKRVLGIDHGRVVRGEGWVDLAERCNDRGWPRCEFRRIELGDEWPDLGSWDVVFCFALYHHLYSKVRDHDTIWRWLRQCTGGTLLWDGPWDTNDSIVASYSLADYTKEAIVGAASRHFDVEIIGPALYRSHRYILRCT